jgi:hypothetical protein
LLYSNAGAWAESHTDTNKHPIPIISLFKSIVSILPLAIMMQISQSLHKRKYPLTFSYGYAIKNPGLLDRDQYSKV